MSNDLPQEEEENAAEGKFGQGAHAGSTYQALIWGQRLPRCCSMLMPFLSCAVFESAQALTNAEVSAILQKIVAQKKQDDPAYQPNPLLTKTQEYVDWFSSNKNEAVNQQIRRWGLLWLHACLPALLAAAHLWCGTVQHPGEWRPVWL
jgi:hypothetical protein